MGMDNMFRFVGLEPERLNGWQHATSDTNMAGIVGNAVPVPLLTRILSRFLYAAGLVSKPIKDPCDQ